MDINIFKENGYTIVKLSGRLDTTTTKKFHNDIASHIDDSLSNLEFDCTDLEYISSQGLRTFIILQKTISEKGGKMVLRNMRPPIKEVFDITGLSSLIKIE